VGATSSVTAGERRARGSATISATASPQTAATCPLGNELPAPVTTSSGRSRTLLSTCASTTTVAAAPAATTAHTTPRRAAHAASTPAVASSRAPADTAARTASAQAVPPAVANHDEISSMATWSRRWPTVVCTATRYITMKPISAQRASQPDLVATFTLPECRGALGIG
jgi:hypothetical protein